MRFIPVLLISVALATASGCFGKDDENGDGTTTTPTGTGTMTPTGPGGTTPTSGATPTNPTSGGGNTNTTTTPPPRELCPISTDFSQNIQPGAPPGSLTTGTCGTIPAGYKTLKLTGNFTVSGGTAPAWVTNGVWVDLVDATPAAVLTCAGPSAPGPAATVTCDMSGAAAPGDYTLAFRGTGNIAFSGSATIS